MRWIVVVVCLAGVGLLSSAVQAGPGFRTVRGPRGYYVGHSHGYYGRPFGYYGRPYGYGYRGGVVYGFGGFYPAPPVYVAPPPVVYYAPPPVYYAPPVMMAPPVVEAPPPAPPAAMVSPPSEAGPPAPSGQEAPRFVETGRRFHGSGSNEGRLDWVEGVLDGRPVRFYYDDFGRLKKQKWID